jgi:hypothetical protein
MRAYLNLYAPLANRRNHMYSAIAITRIFPSVYHSRDWECIDDSAHDHVLPTKVHLGHGPESSNVLHLGQARPFTPQLLDDRIDGFQPGSRV